MNTTIALETSLPTEVILYILTFLDGRDIVRFGATNRAFSTLYKESSLLQSLVQLDFSGAEACIGPPNFGPHERLCYMKARESLWLQSLSGIVTRTIKGPDSYGHPKLCGADEGIYWFVAKTSPGVVGTFQFSHCEEETPWRTFTLDGALDDIEVIHVCLAIQEYDLIAIFTLPPVL